MKYSIFVKGHNHIGGEPESSTLTVQDGETVERLIRRAGITAHRDVVELRLLWDGRQCEPINPPTPPVWPDPTPISVNYIVRRKAKKRKKKHA